MSIGELCQMQNEKITIVIPTLQKNKSILNMLIDSLNSDNSVDEIILIDNSLKGFEHKSEKLQVITPAENLYVNPSWNLGVETARNRIVGLLNDDIIIPANFCGDVAAKMTPEMGIVGMNGWRIEEIPENSEVPPKEEITLEPASYMDWYFGIVLFFYKESYHKIPDDIKIVYGDSWIFTRSRKAGKKNQRICGATIYHYGSLSSGGANLHPIAQNDSKVYKKLTVKWYHRLFSYEELWDYYKLRILGLTFRLKKKDTFGRHYD